MAPVHGKNTNFQLGTAGTPAVLVDISAYCDTAALQRAIESSDVTGFGTSDKTYVIGVRSGNIPIGGPWDPTLDAQMAALLGAATGPNFQLGPQGTTAGQIKYTGQCNLIKYDMSGKVNDKWQWTGELQITGAVTRATF